MDTSFLYSLNGITAEEFSFVKQLMSDMTADQEQQFLISYSGKRQSAEELLLFILLGFVGAAGIHRMLTGQIATGVIYFLTGGLFFIGTIVDLINYRSLATEYNKKQAMKCAAEIKMQF